MDPKIAARYERVKALAEQGATEGERAAARAAMDRLRRMHPEVGAGPAPGSGPRPSADGAFGFPPHPGAGFRSSGKAAPPKPPETPWVDGIFDFLRGAAENLREGLNLRERVLEAIDLTTTVNTRTARIVVTIPLADLDEIYEDFGDERAPEIATIISSLVREEFMATLDSMGIEDD